MNFALLFGCFILSAIVFRTINPFILIISTAAIYWLVTWVVKQEKTGE